MTQRSPRDLPDSPGLRRTASPLLELCRTPVGQGVTTGLISLVPVRRYPRWLRATIAWAPALTVAAAVVTPERVQQAARTAGVELDLDDGGSRDDHGSAPLGSRLAVAALAGGAAYGLMRGGLWADTALEDGLRRLRVPAPRVVLAAAGGVVTWRAAALERRRDAEAAA